MSTLKAFLQPVVLEETREVVVSERFQDEKGNAVPFVVKSITQEENDQLIRLSTRQVKASGGQYVEKFDKTAYQNRIVVACTAVPDFQAEEMLKAYHAPTPLDVPGKMLKAGEFAKLVTAIMEINKFSDADELADEAKN